MIVCLESRVSAVVVQSRVIVEEMSGSRRFLLLLLLACVTCVILLQVTLDGWNLGSAFAYNDGSSAKEMKIGIQLTEPTFKSVTQATMKMTSVISAFHNKVTKTTQDNLKESTALLNATHRIQARVQVRRLPLGRSPSKSPSKPILVNRQERIQEILKQSNSIHGRSTIDPMKTLKSMPIVDPINVTRIIVITYFRAGSSFFGDLLQQNWKTFYHFEPLHSMTYDSRIGDKHIPKVFDLFNGIFKCNFSEVTNYMQWVKRPRNQFLFAHNLFLWVTCHGHPKTCFDPSFVNAVCLRAPVHVVKVTRLHMRHLRNYLQDNPDLKVKVVYLTRDPRGIVSSRWSLDWCNGTDCSNPNVLCKEMDEDIKIFEGLQQEQPLNFIKVRYEDMSLNPKMEAEKLFKFLQLPFSQSVQKFLKTHTVGRRTEDNNPYSTRRNSTAMAFSWRERFSYKQVLEVQLTCENVLNKLNHSLITSPGQLPYPNGKKVNNSSVLLKERKKETFNRNPLAKKYFAKRHPLINSSDILHVPFQSNHLELKNLNNTNIEIHKTYKVLDSLSAKNNSKRTDHLTTKTTLTR